MARRSGRQGAVYRYKIRKGERRFRWQIYVPVDVTEPDGPRKRVGKAGYLNREDAEDALSDAIKARRRQEEFRTDGAPRLDAYAQQWLEGRRLAASTVQGYRRIIRNHITPHLGSLRVDKITATRIARHYRDLEQHGRVDSGHEGEPLSANSVNKVHVVLGAILDAAVDDGFLQQNPAKKSRVVNAPTGRDIRAERPEIRTWSGSELRDFLAWDRDLFNDELFPLWRTIAFTGMRRSEALALRWSDVDFQSNRVSVRRAVDTAKRGMTKKTKTGSARVIELDATTAQTLKAWRALRGTVHLDYARPNGIVFGNDEGEIRSPNEISRRWRLRVRKAQDALPELPTITLHELRHTHATLMLQNGENPKIVQERLGHSTISTTMNIYSHVTPTMQRTAVDRLASLVESS